MDDQALFGSAGGEKGKMDDLAVFGSAGEKKVKWMTRLCLVECKIWEGRG